MQLLLTGSMDEWCPPARCLDFFEKAAFESDLLPGMRCFFVMGACLGQAAQQHRALDAEAGIQGFAGAHTTSSESSGDL